jgi:hypothetical protein
MMYSHILSCKNCDGNEKSLVSCIIIVVGCGIGSAVALNNSLISVH